MEKYNKQWYLDRIGKRVYRTEAPCKCEVCVIIGQKGVIIADQLHAQYLYDCQNELDLYYSDNPISNGTK